MEQEAKLRKNVNEEMQATHSYCASGKQVSFKLKVNNLLSHAILRKCAHAIHAI